MPQWVDFRRGVSKLHLCPASNPPEDMDSGRIDFHPNRCSAISTGWTALSLRVPVHQHGRSFGQGEIQARLMKTMIDAPHPPRGVIA